MQVVRKPAKKKWDSVYMGLAAGILAPVAFFFAYFMLNKYFQFNYLGNMSWRKLFFFLELGKAYAPVISLCVIADLAVFLFFIWKNMNFSARGVLFATFLYAVLIILLKIFL